MGGLKPWNSWLIEVNDSGHEIRPLDFSIAHGPIENIIA